MIAPKVNGLSFVNMMELVGRLPSKTFKKQEVHCSIVHTNRFLMQVAHFPDSPHLIIFISSKTVILKALKANSFNHIIFMFCIIFVAYSKQWQNIISKHCYSHHGHVKLWNKAAAMNTQLYLKCLKNLQIIILNGSAIYRLLYCTWQGRAFNKYDSHCCQDNST